MRFVSIGIACSAALLGCSAPKPAEKSDEAVHSLVECITQGTCHSAQTEKQQLPNGSTIQFVSVPTDKAGEEYIYAFSDRGEFSISLSMGGRNAMTIMDWSADGRIDVRSVVLDGHLQTQKFPTGNEPDYPKVQAVYEKELSNAQARLVPET